MHQTWVREPETGIYRLDIFREPHVGDTWICRRDERIRLPYERIIERTADGIPYLGPEICCVQGEAAPTKDDADFAGVLPLLDRNRRDLAGRVRSPTVHPGHRWLPVLGSTRNRQGRFAVIVDAHSHILSLAEDPEFTLAYGRAIALHLPEHGPVALAPDADRG